MKSFEKVRLETDCASDNAVHAWCDDDGLFYVQMAGSEYSVLNDAEALDLARIIVEHLEPKP